KSSRTLVGNIKQLVMATCFSFVTLNRVFGLQIILTKFNIMKCMPTCFILVSTNCASCHDGIFSCAVNVFMLLLYLFYFLAY
ncbi:hypothetical protein J1N35_029162, partial [Gossypium stocksii]